MVVLFHKNNGLKIAIACAFLLGCFKAFGSDVQSECDSSALNYYFKFRSALLENEFEPNEILSMFKPGYEEKISEGLFYRHFMAMRLKEAKVSRVLAFNSTCSEDKIHLKLKTENFNSEYSRRYMAFEKHGESFYVVGASDDKPGTSLDKDVLYKSLPSKN